MTKEKFSIILTTNRGIESLKPLFVVTDENSELIVIDRNYNEQTKDWLKTQSGYEKIVYAPVKESPIYYARNFSQGLNTALMLSEYKWIVKIDDNVEFKDDFFVKARENIENFTDMLSTPFVIIGQKLWASQNHQRWDDNSSGLTSRHTEVNNPSFTFSFGVYPVTAAYILNGYDERYDISWGVDDINFLHRLLVSQHKVFFDRELMGYSENHPHAHEPILPTKILYDIENVEINLGKVRAFNPFNLKEMQQEYLAKKDDFIVMQ